MLLKGVSFISRFGSLNIITLDKRPPATRLKRRSLYFIFPSRHMHIEFNEEHSSTMNEHGSSHDASLQSFANRRSDGVSIEPYPIDQHLLPHAVILAGGKGTRLKPYTDRLPKPLVPLGGMPILELIIRQLAHHGFQTITLCVGHMAEHIHAYFGDGARFGLHIEYTQEEKPLGTAGPLAVLKNLPEHLLVMNADVVTDLNFTELMRTHREHGGMATLAAYQKTTQIEFGILDMMPNGNKISGFREKPTLVHSVCMGIHAIHRDALQYIPANEFCGIDMLMERLMQAGHSVHAHHFEGYWLDIGRHTDYATAQRDFDRMKHRLLPPETKTLAKVTSPRWNHSEKRITEANSIKRGAL
jgi:NDP-mannose synthase